MGEKRFVWRDASCGFPHSINFYGEPLHERNRFVGEKRFVWRDASCGFPHSINFCGEPLRERNRFVCISVLEKVRTDINADLWRIWNGCVSFPMLWPPYKWWFCCPCILCFWRFCILYRVDEVCT